MSRLKFYCGLLLFFLFLALALFAPFVAPYSPLETNLEEQLRGPSVIHWFGQNHHGQDLLSIVMYGTRISFLVGTVTVLISAGVGIFVGLMAGYSRNWIDSALSRLIDVVLAFPGILLAIAITAVLGPSVTNVIVALVIAGWVPFARLVRGQVLSIREREFVRSARALGARHPRIVFRHILPNLWSPIVVQATYAMAAAILAESSLSFLGLGVPVGTPSWGGAVNDGVRYLLQASHMATFPGLAVMLSVLALNFLGDGLRDWLHER